MATGPGRLLYLEDFHEGQRFSTGSATLDAAAIKGFAAEFDPQPFHLDEAAAESSFFQGLAASGWHTAALTMRLLVGGGAMGDGLPVAGGLIGGGLDLRWPRPTRPGDTLRVDCVVAKVAPSRSRPERGMVTMRCETLNQNDEVAQVMVTNLVVPRRP
ncbi:MaoC family dehydratase [Amaricoccus sp.]|uniref:MaoC family dehydratase n=1 Tax=Amaricoccus sp. TaxID=1872485 RepID=UPI002630F517|nr:MaoC family dehydratase [uncultured Amaricoccus sp.]